MLILLILITAVVTLAVIATVVDLHSDGLHRLPERSFGPAGNDDVDLLGRLFATRLR